MDESAGRPLRDVYSVSLGVALVLAVEQVIDLERHGVPLRANSVLPFLAFIATAFSLYHWAVRFIDLPYEGDGERPPGAVVTALVVGSVELLLLIGLSILVSKPETFLGWLAALLGFEVLAGIALHGARAYGTAAEFARRYLAINVGAAVLSGVAAIVVASVSPDELVPGIAAAAIAWGRATAFYWTGFHLLFGGRS